MWHISNRLNFSYQGLCSKLIVMLVVRFRSIYRMEAATKSTGLADVLVLLLVLLGFVVKVLVTGSQ